MSTRFRVDRNASKTTTPLGMVSIVYLGGSLREAEQVFRATHPGVNGWNQPDHNCGVTLAEWDERKYDYIILRSKFN